MIIICECGHSLKDHYRGTCHGSDPIYAGCDCECDLSCEAVEARYWAKKYKWLYDDAEDRVKVLVALIEVRQDAQAEEIERLRAALEDIAHGVIGNLSSTEQVKILMSIADKALREIDGE